jgi:hypothetical protein
MPATRAAAFVLVALGLVLPASAQAQGATKTTLVIDPNPSVAGALATYTATVVADRPAGPATPSGTVSFANRDGSAIGRVSLDADGQARMTMEGGAGAWPVQALYSGDLDFAASTATAVHTINRADTLVTLSAAPNPAVFGQDIRFAVKVNARPPSDCQPEGILSFTFAGARPC